MTDPHHPHARYRSIPTTLGPFRVEVHPDGRITTDFGEPSDACTLDPDMMPELFAELEAYFAGQPARFRSVPTPQGPPFFQRAWEACRAIPQGETISYGELAERAGGSRSAARAAGQAMRNNPMPVIVPCHRVVGSDGKLHGYAGSQDPDGDPLNTKRRLLDLESRSRV